MTDPNSPTPSSDEPEENLEIKIEEEKHEEVIPDIPQPTVPSPAPEEEPNIPPPSEMDTPPPTEDDTFEDSPEDFFPNYDDTDPEDIDPEDIELPPRDFEYEDYPDYDELIAEDTRDDNDLDLLNDLDRIIE